MLFFVPLRTALAEAELEYDPQHKSKEVYVTFPLNNLPTVVQEVTKGYVYLHIS